MGKLRPRPTEDLLIPLSVMDMGLGAQVSGPAPPLLRFRKWLQAQIGGCQGLGEGRRGVTAKCYGGFF